MIILNQDHQIDQSYFELSIIEDLIKQDDLKAQSAGLYLFKGKLLTWKYTIFDLSEGVLKTFLLDHFSLDSPLFKIILEIFGIYFFQNNHDRSFDKINKLYESNDLIFQKFDSKELIYFLVAYYSSLENPTVPIKLLSFPFTELTIKGFMQFCKLVPSQLPFFLSNIIKILNPTLLDLHSPEKDVIQAFNFLMMLELNTKLFTTQLVLQYSFHLSNPNHRIRRAAAVFMNHYNSLFPNIDIILRLLAVITTEHDEITLQTLTSEFKYDIPSPCTLR